MLPVPTNLLRSHISSSGLTGSARRAREADGVPVFSRDQAMAECDELVQRAVDARAAKDKDAEVDALLACIAHPCAAHELQLTELWSELAGAYRSQGRSDEAIDAWEQAIAAGYRSVPHPRADIAELLLDAGRRAEADALFEQLRIECADDVWLYNSAGFAYAHAGDDQEAVRWLDAGIDLALATRDREALVGQLNDLRDRSLKALGREVNGELAARVEAFEPPGPRPSAPEYFGGTEPEPRPCDHCGWDPDEDPAVRMPVREVEALAKALRRSGTAQLQTQPVTREKVGRNQPCPCRSGRKYKHCHGR